MGSQAGGEKPRDPAYQLDTYGKFLNLSEPSLICLSVNGFNDGNLFTEIFKWERASVGKESKKRKEGFKRRGHRYTDG